MPMQIGLDELLTMLVSRVEEMGLDVENQKSRFNIMFRVLYRKGLFDENDVLEAIREENKILLELGLIKAMPDDKTLKAAADNLMLWIKGDAGEIRASLDEYRKRLEEAQAQQNKPHIDVAPAGVLNELDRLGANNNSKKLIL
ncbi:MAG: hypothetical protein IJU15_04845 [Synergistaceae bacterium]|nr:hypothetical protein [Synergistaceae bacterium]MBQ9404291.1 hypothetical protein [Synergistaceae bacterium]MBR0203780.1 hypothetical protein [Synergistaceae bacterium]